jgi:sterol desaturase/sphingolipid hydroxylase (fatty acid hydroxylase superfamily)
VSLVDRVAAVVIKLVLPFTIGAPVLAFLYQHRLFDLSLDALWLFALLYIGQDFCYYWFHRASHGMRWFWASHVVHHSPNELNFSAAFRLGVTGRIAGSTLFYAPMVWLGFEPHIVLAVVGVNLLYQYWLHADWIPKLGWLEYVLNTPSHHRVHHSRQLVYLDCNYGGTLIIFDRLFGTFVEERADHPVEYGLVEPITTYNPFYIEFHEWSGILRDVLRARSWNDVVGYIFGPPGWAPGGKGLTTENLRKAAQNAAVADAPSPQSADLQLKDMRERPLVSYDPSGAR